MYKSPIYRILIKSKSGNYNALYAILAFAGVFSIITSYSARGTIELNPLTSSGNLSTYYALLSPIFVMLLFYDTISSKVADNSLKKILSEPIGLRTIRRHTTSLLISFSLLYSLTLVIPGAILSYFISGVATPDYLLRYIFVVFPTFLYILFFTSIAFLISASTSKPSSSILISFFVVAFCYFLWIPLMQLLNVAIIGPILGISQNSSAALSLGNEESYFIPTQGYNNSIIPLGYPSVVGFNLQNLLVYSFNGTLSSSLRSLELSLIFMIPTFFYIILILLGVNWRVSNLKSNY